MYTKMSIPAQIKLNAVIKTVFCPDQCQEEYEKYDKFENDDEK